MDPCESANLLAKKRGVWLLGSGGRGNIRLLLFCLRHDAESVCNCCNYHHCTSSHHLTSSLYNIQSLKIKGLQ